MNNQKLLQAFDCYFQHGLYGIINEEETGLLLKRSLVYDQNPFPLSVWIEEKGELRDVYVEGFKPLLHPIERITEPILEGGRVPLCELCKIGLKHLPIHSFEAMGQKINVLDEHGMAVLRFWYHNGGVFATGISSGSFSVNNQLQLFQKCYEWGLDIHNLIPKGYAKPIEL